MDIYSPKNFLDRVIYDQEEKERKVLSQKLRYEINLALSTTPYIEKDRSVNKDDSVTIRYEIKFILDFDVYNTRIAEKILDEFREEGWRCSKTNNSYCFQMHVIEKKENTPPANRYSILEV